MKCLISAIVKRASSDFAIGVFVGFLSVFLQSGLRSTSLFFCLLLRRIRYGYEHTPRIFLPLCKIVKRFMLELNMLNSNSMHIKFNAIAKEEIRQTNGNSNKKKMPSKKRKEIRKHIK